jgi:hypothetical protein
MYELCGKNSGLGWVLNKHIFLLFFSVFNFFENRENL